MDNNNTQFNNEGTNDAGVNQNINNTNTGAPANMVPVEEANGKKAVASLVIGIILNVVNIAMICSTLLGGGFLYGGFFIFAEIIGIQNAVLGKNSPKRGMAIAGMVLNIIALVGSALLLILGLVFKFMD